METIRNSIYCVFLFCISCNYSVPENGIENSNFDTIALQKDTVNINISKDTQAAPKELEIAQIIPSKDTLVVITDTIKKLNIVVTKPKLSIQDIYLSQVGVREKTGKNDGPEVEMYLKSVGLNKGYAWCSAFVHWALDSAGYDVHKITAWAPTSYNQYNIVVSKGKFNKDPKPGDVFVLYYPNLKRIGHTGFFNKKQNSTIYESVEGNTNQAGSREGDGVYKKYRSFNATYAITRWIDEK